MKLYQKWLVFFGAGSTYLVAISPYYVNKIILDPPANNFVSLFGGRLYFSIGFLIFTISGFYFLYVKYRESRGIARKNLLIVIIGTGITGGVCTFFGIITTMITASDNHWFVPYFSIPVVVAILWFMNKKD